MVAGSKPTVALVSPELAPFDDGEVGRYALALSRLLAGDFETTLFTSGRHRSAYRRARRRSPDSLPPARVVFVDEPRRWDAGHAFSRAHAWSAGVHLALLAEYGPSGPDLVEFGDPVGAGCVSVQAKRTRAALADTTVCVRLHGSAEIRDVLDGYLPPDRGRRFSYDLERYALRFCDRLLWAGGDVLGTYQRFYGSAALAGATRLRHPPPAPTGRPLPAADRRAGPLRLLYADRLGRREGARELVAALLGLGSPDWRLTMIGPDSASAPLGTSMRGLLELELAGDDRVRMLGSLSADQLAPAIEAHDALVVPARWACWPEAALTALERGRPVIATATGGLAEIVEEGVSGWLAHEPSAEALAALLGPLVARPGIVRELAPGPAAELGASLADPDEIRAGYAELCEASGKPSPRESRRRASSEPPLVSIVIPYFELDRYVEQAVASAAAQTHPRTEILIVNDGSLRGEDEILLELESRYGAAIVTQANSGLGAARNLGIGLCRGTYVLPLDADNLLEPQFVARCVEALEADPEIAYVTSWLRYLDAGGRPWKGTEELLMPISNSGRAIDSFNVAGDAVAVLRRRVFDGGLAYSTDVAGFEDWTLYREMRDRGLVGHAIPEPLIGYRLRDDSMMRALTGPREEWAKGAADAHLVERAIDWSGPRS